MERQRERKGRKKQKYEIWIESLIFTTQVINMPLQLMAYLQ